MKRPILKPFDKDKFELVEDYELDLSMFLRTKGWRDKEAGEIPKYHRYTQEKLNQTDFKLVIPKGYKTNGANIPRLLWSFFPPNRPEYLSAVVVHDYLCDEAQKNTSYCGNGEFVYKSEGITFLLADEVFKAMMSELEVAKWKTTLFYLACRVWHKVRYGV